MKKRLRLRIILITAMILGTSLILFCVHNLFGWPDNQPPNELESQRFHWLSISSLNSKNVIEEVNHKIYVAGAALTGADPSTFVVAADQNRSPIEYAKDKDHVYYISPYWNNANQLVVNGVEVLPLDPKTFTPIYGVPLDETLSSPEERRIVGTKPNYQCLYDSYGSDDKEVYFQDFPIEGADPSSFEIIFDDHGCPTNYDRDNKFVYYDLSGEKASVTLSSIDVATFKVLDDSGYTEDKNHVYSQLGIPISNNPGSFMLVEPPASCGVGCEYDAQDNFQKFIGGQVI